jgi:AcrR family transcriptional regulator
VKLAGIRSASNNEQLVQGKREQIIKNATRLFARKGYAQTSMKDIGKACSMTPANLYNYIGKKDDLLTLVIRDNYAYLYKILHEIEDDIERLAPVEALTSTVEKFLKLHDNNRDNTSFVSRDINSFRPSIRLTVIESSANIEALFERIIKKGCNEGVFTSKDPWLMARNIMAMGVMWCLQYPIYSKRYNIDEYIKMQQEHALKLVCCKTAAKV